MKFHAALAQAANALSEFRLLNNCPPCLIGCNDNGDGYRKLMGALDCGPSGMTPLCRHINDIVAQIQGIYMYSIVYCTFIYIIYFIQNYVSPSELTHSI